MRELAVFSHQNENRTVEIPLCCRKSLWLRVQTAWVRLCFSSSIRHDLAIAFREHMIKARVHEWSAA